MSVSFVNPIFIAFLIFCLVWLLAAAVYSLKLLIRTLTGDYSLPTKAGYGLLFSTAFCLAVATCLITWTWIGKLVATL